VLTPGLGTPPEGERGRWPAAVAPAEGPDLVRRVVACAAAGDGAAARVQRAVSGRMAAARSTDLDGVLADVARRSPPERAATDAAGRALAAAGARLLVVGRPGYPRALAPLWPELGAPAWVFVRSPGGLPAGPAVAVVGTRRPTLDGLRTARALGRFLALRGVTVVSGMARGVDQAAHAGALDVGGPTVAVLGAGLDVDYPRGDQRLRDAVAAAGGLVTEYLPGVPPRPVQFLERNRILSGLADALVVVEGRARSGALHTARLAAEQGRQVLAAPGSLNAPTSEGPLALLRDGALVLTAFEDVLAALPAVPGTEAASRAVPGTEAVSRGVPGTRDDVAGPVPGGAAAGLDAEARAVLPLLSARPASPGALAGATGLPVVAVLVALSELEGRGLARLAGSGFVAAPAG